MVLVPLFSHSLITCYEIWVNSAKFRDVFRAGRRRRLTLRLQRGHQPSLIVVNNTLKRPPGHARSSVQAESSPSIRARDFLSWKRMWCDGKEQRGCSTLHHIKLAFISCVPHRATAPQLQFYSSGWASPEALLQGYEQLNVHLWGLQLAIRKNK